MPPFRLPSVPNEKLLRITLLATLSVGVIIVLKTLGSLIQPLLVAIFLYYIITPATKWLIGKKIPLFFAHLVMITAVAAIVSFVGWIIWSNIDDVARMLPIFQKKLSTLVRSSTSGWEHEIPIIGESLKNLLRGFDVTRPPESVTEPLFSGFLSLISMGVLTLFYLVFIIHEASMLPRRMEAVWGAGRSRQILAVWKNINSGIIHYLYIKFLASALTAVIALAVMLTFQLDFALLWSSIIFVANFIPYIGSIVAFIFPIAFSILQFQSAFAIFGLAALLIAVDMYVGNYWEPRYAGEHLNLSPLLVLFWLAFLNWMWGPMGLLLAVPLLVCLKSIFDNVGALKPAAILISNTPEEEIPPPQVFVYKPYESQTR